MKAGACSVCTHPQRAEIDAAHVAGVSIRELARQFKRNKDTIQRHVRQHVPAAAQLAAEAVETRETAAGSVILAELADLTEHAKRLLVKAESGDQRFARLFDEYMKDLQKT